MPVTESILPFVLSEAAYGPSRFYLPSSTSTTKDLQVVCHTNKGVSLPFYVGVYYGHAAISRAVVIQLQNSACATSALKVPAHAPVARQLGKSPAPAYGKAVVGPYTQPAPPTLTPRGQASRWASVSPTSPYRHRHHPGALQGGPRTTLHPGRLQGNFVNSATRTALATQGHLRGAGLLPAPPLPPLCQWRHRSLRFASAGVMESKPTVMDFTHNGCHDVHCLTIARLLY